MMAGNVGCTPQQLTDEDDPSANQKTKLNSSVLSLARWRLWLPMQPGKESWTELGLLLHAFAWATTTCGFRPGLVMVRPFEFDGTGRALCHMPLLRMLQRKKCFCSDLQNTRFLSIHSYKKKKKVKHHYFSASFAESRFGVISVPTYSLDCQIQAWGENATSAFLFHLSLCHPWLNTMLISTQSE